MEAHGGCDRDRVDVLARDESVEARLAFNARVQRRQVPQAVFANVANDLEIAVRQRAEVADEVRAPIPATDDAYVDGLFI